LVGGTYLFNIYWLKIIYTGSWLFIISFFLYFSKISSRDKTSPIPLRLCLDPWKYSDSCPDGYWHFENFMYKVSFSL
jgi:hypothetical protein